MNFLTTGRGRLTVKSPSDHQNQPFIKASQLEDMSFGRQEFLLDSLLVRNLSLIAGPPKIGKSFLCLSFIKQLISEDTKAFYCSFEDDYRRIHRRLERLTLFSDNLAIHCGRENNLGATESEEFNLIQEIAHQEDVAIIVIDTMERILPIPKHKRDYHFYVHTLDKWAKLALQSNTCILMVHHTRKGDGSPDYHPQSAILGSVGIPATFDTNLVMARDKTGNIVLHVEGKDVIENTFKLEKNGVEFFWETKSDLDALGETQKQVLLFIGQHAGCTQNDIVINLAKNKSQISQIVSRLCGEGFLSREDNKLFTNNPY
jgi:hypothetical protein